MKIRTIGSFAYGTPPVDLYVSGGLVKCHGTSSLFGPELGSEVTFSSKDLEQGKKARLKLVAKLVDNTNTNFNGGSMTLSLAVNGISDPLPSTIPVNAGIVFLDLEFVSVGYFLAGSSNLAGTYPGSSEAYYIGTFIGGDQIVRGVSGRIQMDTTANVTVNLSGLTGSDQVWFALSELSYKVEGD